MESGYVDKRAIVSFFLMLWAVIAYFAYLMHYSLIRTPWDIVARIALPISILPLIGYFFTSEILECRKCGRSRELCLKRFARAFGA